MASLGPSVALTASMATGNPCASSAARNATTATGRSTSRRNSSSRLQISLTGRPTALASAMGDIGAEHIRRLVRQPHLQRAVGVEACQGRRRLQLGVVNVLVMVGGFDFGFGVGQRAGYIAFVFIVTRRALLGGEEVTVLVAGKIRRHRTYGRIRSGFQPLHL